MRSDPPSGAGGLIQGRRPFGRLTVPPGVAQHAAAPLPPAQFQIVEPEPAPLDSAKAFVGPNATFYDDRWRWMDWRGRQRSWNWAAAASFGGWFAYRRMYRHAAAYGIWLVLLLALAAAGSPLEPILGALILVGVLGGLYGDMLYLLHFRRIAREVFRAHPEYDARVAALGKAGGVDRHAVWKLAAAVLLGAGLAFALL